MKPCYDRILRERPTATGSVHLEVTTREARALEAALRFAADDELAPCALEAFEGRRTARAYATNVREAVYLFCPSDRAVCLGDPIGVRVRDGLDASAVRGALASALRSRSPLMHAHHRRLGARAPRAEIRLYVQIGAQGRIGGLGFEDDPPTRSDAAFEVLDPMLGVCAPSGVVPSRFEIPVWIGVR